MGNRYSFEAVFRTVIARVIDTFIFRNTTLTHCRFTIRFIDLMYADHNFSKIRLSSYDESVRISNVLGMIIYDKLPYSRDIDVQYYEKNGRGELAVNVKI
jgi:hypothetical protein